MRLFLLKAQSRIRENFKKSFGGLKKGCIFAAQNYNG
jgi:hypothetical protein